MFYRDVLLNCGGGFFGFAEFRVILLFPELAALVEFAIHLVAFLACQVVEALGDNAENTGDDGEDGAHPEK